MDTKQIDMFMGVNDLGKFSFLMNPYVSVRIQRVSKFGLDRRCQNI